jgi:hypothetical protein
VVSSFSHAQANKILLEIRRRKGLPAELPQLSDFHASELE